MKDRDYKKLLDELLHLEGDRLAPYRDAGGNLNVSSEDTEVGGVAMARFTVLEAHVRAVMRELEDLWPVVSKRDSVRQRVLAYMAFTMGIRGLLAMARFVSAVEFRLWDVAAYEMVISQWGKQSPQRAMTLADMMRTGRDDAMSENTTAEERTG